MQVRSAVLLGIAAAAMTTAARASDQFMKPTAEELSMTSLPGYPGTPAVVLYYEEVAKNDIHVVQRYERLKVLTEEGKKYANVELDFVRTKGEAFGAESNQAEITDIVGRTIHPDGTVIPFTGKPYLKTNEENSGIKAQARVFTLPDVEVGSIIEYRYSKRYSDHYYEAPDWYIQRELFVKSAHYEWYPTTRDLVDYKQRAINSISWFPILPVGSKIDHREMPTSTAFHGAQQVYSLDMKDVPPTTKEEYMPPLASYSYRVYFNFTAYRSGDEYWKDEGKEWSKKSDSFMKVSSEIADATSSVTAGATSTDDKLRKIYAKVESLENTDYTHEHTKHEDGQVSNVTDVLKHGRGTSTQLTELFVAMARAAGLKSYLMLVPSRAENFFTPMWLSFQQFDDVIAITQVDGKDVYLDPGFRYEPYGHLAWEHTFVEGLRQVDGGSTIVQTPGEGYAGNKVARVANLTMDEHGELSGKIDMTYVGSPAVRWRHRALSGDEQELKDELRKAMENLLPTSLEVKVDSVKNIDAYEQPLIASFTVTGTMGTPTGKRLVMPADLFEARTPAAFSQEKRQLAVDFQYAETMQDALRIRFPKGFEVEATPKDDKYELPKRGLYAMSVTSDGTSFTTRRTRVMGEFLFPASDYPALRSFYTQVQTKDKDSVVLKIKPVETASSGGN